jgi:predicted aminopeptidase
MMRCLNARLLSAGLMCAVLALSAGCGGWPPGFIPSSFFGEIGYLSGAVPIESAVDDPTLTQEQRDKLAFLLRARDYCRDVVGLQVDNNFQTFVNLHGKPLAYNLTGSRKDSFQPYVWYVPLAGQLPYLGFFKLKQATNERNRLVDAGYDTFMYEVDAFAIPTLPDPVSSRLLDRAYGDLADTVAHELTHNTVMTMSDVTFSESLAVFVGRTVAVEFLGVEFGEDTALIQDTINSYEDDDVFRSYLSDLTDELSALYAGNLSSEEKIAQRQVVFESWRDRFKNEAMPQLHDPDSYSAYGERLLNNAFLLVNTRYYSDQEVFAQAFDLAGRDWARAFEIFGAAGRSPDPVQYLTDLINAGNP